LPDATDGHLQTAMTAITAMTAMTAMTAPGLHACVGTPGYSGRVSNAALDAAGAEVERFSAPTGRFFGWVGVGLAVVVVVLAAADDPLRDRKGLYLAGCLAAACWVILIRPVVSSNTNGVVLRNMLRDTFVPWSKIERCRVVHTLQIATEEQRFHGIGVGRSARTMVRRGYGRSSLMPRGALMTSAGRGLDRRPEASEASPKQQYSRGVDYQDYVESRISDRARYSRADDLQPIVVWSALPLAVATAGCALLALLILT
jgi:hypothetical protein